MKEINFIEDVFDSMILSAAICACTVHDDDGKRWVAVTFVEVNG